MDFATIIGLIAGMGAMIAVMMMGGDITIFFDATSLVLIAGGCAAASMVRFPFNILTTGFIQGGKIAFSFKRQSSMQLIEKITELSDIIRKQGPLGLENVEIEDKFLAKGVRMIADGYDAAIIREALEKERDLNLYRIEAGSKVYKSLGDAGPAFGMLSTVIAMVQMFANMQDPSTLGPYMALALIGTMYGSIVANVFCIPISDKLKGRMEEDEVTDNLIIDGVIQMRENKSPTFIKDMLVSYLPHKMRADMEEAA